MESLRRSCIPRQERPERRPLAHRDPLHRNAQPARLARNAQFVVPVCPTGMIFVPCRKGISHNPAEYSEPGQLAAGTRVLTQALLELAEA